MKITTVLNRLSYCRVKRSILPLKSQEHEIHLAQCAPPPFFFSQRQSPWDLRLYVADHRSLTKRIKEFALIWYRVLPEISAVWDCGNNIRWGCARANCMLMRSKAWWSLAVLRLPSIAPHWIAGLQGTRRYIFLFRCSKLNILFLSPLLGRLGIQESPMGNGAKMTYLTTW